MKRLILIVLVLSLFGCNSEVEKTDMIKYCNDKGLVYYEEFTDGFGCKLPSWDAKVFCHEKGMGYYESMNGWYCEIKDDQYFAELYSNKTTTLCRCE